MMRRLYYLDTLKGILIILVILGHVIQFLIDDYQHNFIFRFIYSFHMPLFLLISGFLTYKPSCDATLIKKRALQLLTPFVVWAFITPLFKKGICDIHETVSALMYPDNGLWFLYNLFVYSAVVNLSERLSNKWSVKQEYLLALPVCMMLAAMLVLKTLFNCTQLVWYLPFFLIGYYIRKYNEYIEKKKHIILMLGGAIFVIGMPFWMMREDPLFYEWVNFGGAFSYLYRWGIMMAGAVFFFFLGRKLFNKPIKCINSIGQRTLGIYAMQFIAIYHIGNNIAIDNITVRITAITALSLISCYTLTILISKTKYLRTLLIGEK